MVEGSAERVAVVTGANSGVGLEIARGLARTGHRVVLACRDPGRGAAAARAIAASLPPGRGSAADRVEALPLDLASLASVRAFAARLGDRPEGVSVLVNNAGLVRPGGGLTADGHELHFGVMHLGHFALTQGLLDALRRARVRSGRASRVLSVSAWGHRLAKPDFEAARRIDRNAVRAYSRAKLAQVTVTRCWAGRVRADEVLFASLHPGIVRTNLAADYGGLAQRAVDLIAVPPAKSAELALHLASEHDFEGLSGDYFTYRTFRRSFGRTPAATSRHADDPAVQRDLWTLSEELSHA